MIGCTSVQKREKMTPEKPLVQRQALFTHPEDHETPISQRWHTDISLLPLCGGKYNMVEPRGGAGCVWVSVRTSNTVIITDLSKNIWHWPKWESKMKVGLKARKCVITSVPGFLKPYCTALPGLHEDIFMLAQHAGIQGNREHIII